MAKQPKNKRSRNVLCEQIWRDLERLDELTTVIRAAAHLDLDELCVIANALNLLVVETSEFLCRIAAERHVGAPPPVAKKAATKKKGHARG